MIHFTAPNNRFSGYLPSSFCDLVALGVLVLSNNRLVGEIPQCFENLTNNELTVLDLRSNGIIGILPPIFGQCRYLSTLSLGGNLLDGPIPRSLADCLIMQIIDLGNNRFNDTFPYWLGALPSLKVLVLRSNNFYGSLGSSNETRVFSQLQILDLSNNSFNDVFPRDLIQSLKAMITDAADKEVATYLGFSYYFFSIQQTVKGFSRILDEIIDTLTIIDVSSNRLT
ncbi:hypothetical protein Dimus_024233 [Dionaea muscipula]